MMRSLIPTRRPRNGGRRGVTMLEFVLTLPILMYIIMLILDMGMVIVANGTMQDAAYAAARAGAQVGGASYSQATNSFPCGAKSAECRTGASYNALTATLAQSPSGRASNPRMAITSGGICTTSSDTYVTTKVTYDHKLMTPGLAKLIGWSGGVADGSAWKMTTTGTSRCEVVR